MIENPELRRNIWLELTLHRLLAMPGILALGFVLAYVLGRPQGQGSAAVAWTALALFGVISVGWGSQLAANSIVDEFRDKTWDTQRMSALDPWELAWGKLAGANVFTWYGGAICLVVFILGAAGGIERVPVLATALLAAGGAVLTHALSMLLGLLTAVSSGRRRASANMLVLLLLFIFFSFYAAVLFDREPAIWYAMRFNPTWFGVVSVWLFAAWAVIGLYRVLCVELQVRTVPVAWLGFAAFLTFYFAGFVVGRIPGKALLLLLAVGFIVTLAMTYLSAWWDRRDIVTVRRFMLHWSTSSRRRALQELPCWLATAPFALGFALILIGLDFPYLPEPFNRLPAVFPLGLWLFALRDIGLLYFFSLARVPRRAELASVLYLGVIYWLLPELFAATGLEVLHQLVLPPIWNNAAAGLGILVLHVALVGGLLWRRWRARQNEMTAHFVTKSSTT